MEDVYRQSLDQVTQLIDATIESDDEDKSAACKVISEALELIHAQYATGFEFYSAWLKLCAELQPGDKAGLSKLYQLICIEFPHFELISSCLDCFLHLQEEEQMLNDELREVMETAVRTCGSDVFTGKLIWEKYLSFEIDEHEDLLEQPVSDPQLVQQSKARLVRLFHRALSLPLVNSESLVSLCDSTLQSFFTASDEAVIQPHRLAQVVSSAHQARACRLSHELAVVQAPASSPALSQAFEAYVSLEVSLGELSRVQRLYDRWLLVCPHAAVFWPCLCFLLGTVKQYPRAVQLAQRAVAFHPTHLPFHRVLVYACEAAGPSAEASVWEYYTKTAAGTGLLATAEDVVDWYHLVAHALRRMHRQDTAGGEDRAHHVLRDWEACLATYYPQWLAGRLAYLHVRVAWEAGGSPSPSPSPSPATKRRPPWWDQAAGYFPRQPEIWQAALAYHTARQEVDVVRGIYRKVLHLALDGWPRHLVAEHFLRFEETHGDRDTLLAAFEKVHPLLDWLPRPPSHEGEGGGEGGGGERGRETTDPDTQNAKLGEEDGSGPDIQNTRLGEGDGSGPDTQNARLGEEGSAGRPRKRPRASPSEASPAPEASPVLSVAPRCVSLGNLPFSAPAAAVAAFLQAVLPPPLLPPPPSPPLDVQLVHTKAGHSGGMAYVHCAQPEAVAAFLQALPAAQRCLQGRPLRVGLGTPPSPKASEREEGEGAGCAEAGARAAAAATVFVCNLSPKASEREVRAFFEACGPVAAVKLNVCKQTGERTGTGLVQFQTSKARDRAVALTGQAPPSLGGDLLVKKSRFGILASPQAPEGKESAGKGEGEGEGEKAAREPPVQATRLAQGDRKATTMFKPRSMKPKIQL